ncbi:hypothetical protein R1sor_004646 [Riccia sorocarpa]|uniref:Uncharacterized protein n=1 Tax=Riccia sorocarpa TaxID=122646 RepID=A0ABD3HLM9_9MARC
MLIGLEQRLKAQQLNDAKAWRLRCREHWLSVDDAPSRYFFIKLKAQWARESLEVLEGEDGVEITDPGEILECIHSFYQGLYSKEVVLEEAARAQEEINIVRACWDLVSEACVRMVQAIWHKRSMLRKDCQGVIKLIPKGEDKKHLGNWRPSCWINI